MISEIATAVGATKNIADLLSKATKVARDKKRSRTPFYDY